jgi:hypothetical protein
MGTGRAIGTAVALNQHCQCVSMDDALLADALAREGASFGARELFASHPHLFSRSAVFVDEPTRRAMRDVVAAVERVVALPAYQELALADAHPHARVATPARGVFLGYDFHLTQDRPQLIEINTNAGGALLNAVLRLAQRACCDPVADALGLGDEGLPQRFLAMFGEEYQLARPGGMLRSVAIADDDPPSQYLYPEMVLFERLFASAGIEAVVCDARELEIRSGALAHRGRPIDLVYNRLTDFPLEDPAHAALARAHREGLAVVTPHPRAHALYADKHRLVTLSDGAVLRSLSVAEADVELLVRHVPRTVRVDPDRRDALWKDRRQLFFKPRSGYGSKAAYRGDKLTRRVFETLLAEPYVAQRIVPPSARVLRVGDETRALKVDIRNFAYAGEIQLVCARLYAGQTTNFRTEGGGFAPVYAAA